LNQNYPGRSVLGNTGVFLLFFGLFFLTFFDAALGDYAFVRRDMSRYALPMWSFSIQTLQEGSIPLWNPLIFCGNSFFANLQTCVFYPITLVFHLFGVVEGIGLYTVLHLALASYFTYIWMRSLGVGNWGSLFAGVAYGFSGFMISAINLTITLSSAAYFPLVLYLFRKMISESDARWVIFTGFSMAFMLLAGEPVVSYATALVIITFSLFKFSEHAFKNRSLDLNLLIRPVVALLLFTLLVSFQVIPFFEKVSQTTRNWMTLENATTWSVPVHHLFGLILPFLSDLNMVHLNYWERQSWVENYYAGIVLFSLIGFAFVKVRDRRFQLLMLLALFGMVLTLGKHTFLYSLFYYGVPLANLILTPFGGSPGEFEKGTESCSV